MKNIETIRSMNKSEMIAYRADIASAMTALLAAYRANIDGTPADTIAQLIEEVGQHSAELIMASLANAKQGDGRISWDNTVWAARFDDAMDYEAAAEYIMGIDEIHPAHLDQLLTAMRTRKPAEPAPVADTAPAEINEIAPDHITWADVEMAASYSVSYTGRTVTAFVEMSGQRYKVTLTGSTCGDLYTAALAAAKSGTTTAVEADDLALVLTDAVPMAERKPAAEPNPDKQRHGEVPEKWFIGQELTGPSWRILFDGDAGKTRVIFPRKPSAAVLEAVKAAGFFWSPRMKSWNKGLTFKAYRAAEKLHAELHRIAAPAI